jgi:hypothetical protein
MLMLIGLALLGILLMRKNGHQRNLKAHHDVSGFVFTNLGVLYSVLLGFTVVNVQQRFDGINAVVKTEAAYLAELFRDAEAFTTKDRQAMQQALKAYAESIVSDEWRQIEKGPHLQTTHKLNELWRTYYDVELTNKKQEILYTESIKKLNDAVNVRLERLLGGGESLSDEMWTFLICGGIILVSFISMFAFESLWLHLLLTSVLAATLAFLLFLIFSLDTAFSGDIQIPPAAMEGVIHNFKVEREEKGLSWKLWHQRELQLEAIGLTSSKSWEVKPIV